ncbi:MAG: hypothetical protein ACI857_001318 [Arenicella sp.]|jgi:hypothetical protein
MPIEIKELVIKTTVNEEQSAANVASDDSDGGNDSSSSDANCAAKLEEVRDEIIAECLDFVSDYMNKINRR